MTYRLIIALVAALSFVGVAAADPPVPPAVMDRPVAAPCCNPPDAATATDSGPFWVAADYLLGYIYSARVPPLVTTNPVGTPRSIAGILNNPSTTVLFDGRVNAEERSGGRLLMGYWLDDEKKCGLEASFSLLESQATVFSANNRGDAILARPYINANVVRPLDAGNSSAREAVLITFPNASSGGIDIHISSSNFYTGYFDISDNFWDEGRFRLDGLLGYRFIRYDEGVRIRQISTVTNDLNLVKGTSLFVGDDFATQNEFHGCELGLRGNYCLENLSVEVLAKVAAGNLRRRVTIAGGQEVTVPGSPTIVRTGGVYALSSNIGQYNFNDFQAMPEFGFTLRYQLSDNLRLRAGYNILFLNSLSRATQQIDETINPNLFPGSGQPQNGIQRPAPTNEKDNVWIMNVSLGAEVVF